MQLKYTKIFRCVSDGECGAWIYTRLVQQSVVERNFPLFVFSFQEACISAVLVRFVVYISVPGEFLDCMLVVEMPGIYIAI